MAKFKKYIKNHRDEILMGVAVKFRLFVRYRAYLCNFRL